MTGSRFLYSIFTGIGKNFFLWFLILSLLPLTAVSLMGYYSSKESLYKNTTEHLSASTELKKKYIETFFSERISDIGLQSHLAENVTFLKELRSLYQSLALPGKEFGRSPEWSALGEEKTKTDMREFVDSYGYHDLFLIDIQGNVLYSVKGEEKVGMNIFTGKDADTLFAEACHRAIDSGETTFSDMEPSRPIGHKLDTFLVQVMLDDHGEKVGLLVLEISLDQIDRLMQDRTGMGLTGETFLIGSDLLMRSDSWMTDGGTAMQTRIETEPVKKWLDLKRGAKGDTTAYPQPVDQVQKYTNHRGIKVFGMISDLEGLEQYGVHWALVAEIAETEALAPVTRLRHIVWLLLAATTAVVAVVSVLVTRGIVAPIRKLSDWASLVGQGDLSLIEGPAAKNEIGELHTNFSRMVESLQEVTKVCEAVAFGDFSKTVVVRSEKDVLGHAVNQMAENLRAAVRQAEVVSTGDFSVQINPWSEQDKLGTTLLRMTIKLQEMAESNKKALADAKQLAEYVNNLPTPVLSVDRDFKIIYINAAGAAFAGLSQTSCIGKYCHELFQSDHCQTRNCRVGQAMRNKRVETAETVIDPDGASIPVRYTGAPVLDENNEVTGALEYFVDVTEEKKAFKIIEKENRLQSGAGEVNDRLRGEQEMKHLCNNLLSGLAELIDIQAGAMYVVNGNELRLCGTYSSTGNSPCHETFALGEGLIGQVAFEKKRIVIKEIPKESVQLISGLLKAAPRELAVIPLLHENTVQGVLELGSFSSFTAENIELLERVSGNIAIAISSVQSRTKLAELLAETQHQAEELQTQQEELQSANEELEAQTLSLREREAELQAQHEELMALNEELEEKTEFLEKQKADIQMKNTELEKARGNLEKKAEELTIASKYKSEFMANMSHELRTPLNSLLLLSHNLSQNKEGNLSDDQVESAQVIYSSGNDLLELINGILDLSKIEVGRVELKIADVSLKEFAGRVQSYFQPQIKEKGLGFSIVVSPQAPPTIATDRQRLEQIIRNLISNAIKFTEKGGITLSMRPLTTGDFPSDKMLTPDSTLAIEVTDTGIGIPKEKQRIIFEAFQQVDGSTSRKYGGTGLGLSISRELAELLGGEIQLTSEQGSGSTFTLYLPFTPPAAVTQEEIAIQQQIKARLEPMPRPAVQQRRKQPAIHDDRESFKDGDKTLLIIEDDQNFARSLIKQGHEKGFKCLASANGLSGLALAEEYKPSAIILDINLPEMNGWEVLDALKKNPSLRHIPVHMMSVEEKTLDAYKKGAVGYLHKPVTQDELHRAFDRLEEIIAKDIKELLVVEDDTILRQEIVKLIGNGDVHSAAVATGKEVIALLREKKFDCMILDIGLPDMTGFELLDQLENEKDIVIPPVIIYTGRELTREESDSLYRYTDSIIIKGVKSIERLLDETALFLHRIVAKMPDEKRKIIANLYEQDAMFMDKKILIVDDDMRNAFALSKILSDRRMETRIANTGRKALEILETEEDIDLVLMDIMMPEMDGYEAIQRIRAREKYWNLPIIALTAKAMPEDKGKCLKAGASDYLAKPIEEARLLSMMRIWLYR